MSLDSNYNHQELNADPSANLDLLVEEQATTRRIPKLLFSFIFLLTLLVYPALVYFTHTTSPWFLLMPKEGVGLVVLLVLAFLQFAAALLMIYRTYKKISGWVLGVIIVLFSVEAVLAQFFGTAVAAKFTCNLYLDNGTNRDVDILVNDVNYHVAARSYQQCIARVGANIITVGKSRLSYQFTKATWIYNYNQANEYYTEKLTYSRVYQVITQPAPDTYFFIGNPLIFETHANYIFKAPDQINKPSGTNSFHVYLLEHQHLLPDSTSSFNLNK